MSRRTRRRRAEARYGPEVGTTYLLHFVDPATGLPARYKHAGHYIGWTTDLAGRLEAHARGTGARLIEVITRAGLGFTLARTWPQTTRDREDLLKHIGDARRFCPECGVKPRHEPAVVMPERRRSRARSRRRPLDSPWGRGQPRTRARGGDDGRDRDNPPPRAALHRLGTRSPRPPLRRARAQRAGPGNRPFRAGRARARGRWPVPAAARAGDHPGHPGTGRRDLAGRQPARGPLPGRARLAGPQRPVRPPATGPPRGRLTWHSPMTHAGQT
jgi:hypothetical protein